MSEEKTKINLKDIVDSKQMRETSIFVVGDKKWWADRITKDQIATHADCKLCSKEFEKRYTFDRYCFNCEAKVSSEKYNALELVEWNGTDMLCTWGGDTYFSDIDDIETYCEDNETDIYSLKLVLCTETSFGSINIAECLQDDLHEDWEPDAELTRIQNELDNYLRKASTNTWTPSNKRVSLK